jgi:hypothetical protein
VGGWGVGGGLGVDFYFMKKISYHRIKRCRKYCTSPKYFLTLREFLLENLLFFNKKMKPHRGYSFF